MVEASACCVLSLYGFKGIDCLFFFFQAEDGIRDLYVTGVQTCALPISLQRYTEQGQKALASGRYEEAEHAFEKIRELEPGMAEVHANLGAIYFQERKFDKAVPALRQAIKLNPHLVKSATLLAISLSELGRYSEALPGLEKGFYGSYDSVVMLLSGLQL